MFQLESLRFRCPSLTLSPRPFSPANNTTPSLVLVGLNPLTLLPRDSLVADRSNSSNSTLSLDCQPVSRTDCAVFTFRLGPDYLWTRGAIAGIRVAYCGKVVFLNPWASIKRRKTLE